MPEDDPDAVARMLEWMYTGDYDDGEVDGDDNREGGEIDDDDDEETLSWASFKPRKKSSSGSRKDAPVEESEDEKRGEDTDKDEASISTTVDEVHPQPSLFNNVLVYSVAEKYDIAMLKDKAKEKFELRAETGNLVTASEFTEIITEIYRTTPSSDRGLRNVVSQICARHTQTIVNDPVFKSSIEETGEFVFDLLQEVLKVQSIVTDKQSKENRRLRNKISARKEEVGVLQQRLRDIKLTLVELTEGIETRGL